MFSAGKGPARAVVPMTAPVLVPPPCSACGSSARGRHARLIDTVMVMLCDDVAGCTVAYRGGVSPETFAAGLRGEILAVAP